jgi:hypothetical protein
MNTKTAGAAGIVAGIGLLIGATSWIASGWTPATFGHVVRVLPHTAERYGAAMSTQIWLGQSLTEFTP